MESEVWDKAPSRGHKEDSVIIPVTASFVLAALAFVPAEASTTVTVRGGYINDAVGPCNPVTAKTGPGTPPSYATVSCLGGSLYNGALSGHTVINLKATFYTNGNATGTFDEWFYGTYTADRTVGGIHWKGSFSINGATGAFQASAAIVGGTCDFAGSSGSMSYTGHEVNGGYVGTWTRPSTTSRMPCNPLVAPSLP